MRLFDSNIADGERVDNDFFIEVGIEFVNDGWLKEADVGVDVDIWVPFKMGAWLNFLSWIIPAEIFFVFKAGEFSGEESGGDVVGGVGGSPLSS